MTTNRTDRDLRSDRKLIQDTAPQADKYAAFRARQQQSEQANEQILVKKQTLSDAVKEKRGQSSTRPNVSFYNPKNDQSGTEDDDSEEDMESSEEEQTESVEYPTIDKDSDDKTTMQQKKKRRRTSSKWTDGGKGKGKDQDEEEESDEDDDDRNSIGDWN